MKQERKHNELMNEVCRALNYFEHFLAFFSVVSGCVSVSVFVSLIGFPAGIATSLDLVMLIICAITTGIKKYQSIMKKK